MKSAIRLIGSTFAAAALATAAWAADPIKIALVHGLSGSSI